MATERISFIGVFRFGDQICVGCYSPKNAEQADIEAVKQILGGPDVFVEPKKRYTNEGTMFNVHFVADERNRVFAVITARDYPARIAFALLDEVQVKFVTQVGDKSLSCKSGALSKTCKETFRDACLKYEDVRNVDKLASVQDKVQVVKTVMEDNIQQMLANNEKLEDISNNAENLNQQAKVFQNRSTALRRTMKWKAIKMWLLLGLVICILLIIIITPIAIYLKGQTKK